MEDSSRKKLIGSIIRTKRTSLGMTQEELGAKMGLDQSNLSNIENGKTFPSFATLCAIIEILDIEPNACLNFLEFTQLSNSCLDIEISERMKTLSDSTKRNLLEIIKKIKE